jgi:prepilin-type N-terminal cleavage/methylation domain-containing protein
MKRAFTLIESLCVIAILAVMAAITAPAAWSAWRETRVSVSVQRLKQLDYAIRLYESTYETRGAGRWQSVPVDLIDIMTKQVQDQRALIAPPEIWESPCGVHPDDLGTGFIYFPSTDPWSSWEWYSSIRQDESVYIADRHCNSANVRIYSATYPGPKRVILLRLNGSVKVVYRTGLIITPLELDPIE